REPTVGRHELQGQCGARSEAKPSRILSKNPSRPPLEMHLSPDEERGNKLARHGIFVSEGEDRRLTRDQGDAMSVCLLPLEQRVPSLSDDDLDLELRCHVRCMGVVMHLGSSIVCQDLARCDDEGCS